MRRIVVTIDVDETKLREASGCDGFAEAVNSELGWLHDSGMYAANWKEADNDTEDRR